jgi:flap endonuclease-1
MGVRGLSSCLRWATPSASKSPDWADYKGKKIGIDILGLLYKAKAQRTHILVYLSQFMVRCRQYGIVPVPIYDGKPPDEKRPMLLKRAERRTEAATKLAVIQEAKQQVQIPEIRRLVIEKELQTLENIANYLTSEERELSKQFFYSCGVMSYNASGEADNILAYLARRGMINAVISNDYDLLARGVQVLLVPELYALPGDRSGWKEYTLSRILTESSLSYEQFVDMCVLMGCDYNSMYKGIPYKSAFWLVKYGGGLQQAFTTHDLPREPYEKAKSILVGNEDTLEGLMNTKQWGKWGAAPPTPEPETLKQWTKSYLPHLTPQELTLLCSP